MIQRNECLDYFFVKTDHFLFVQPSSQGNYEVLDQVFSVLKVPIPLENWIFKETDICFDFRNNWYIEHLSDLIEILIQKTIDMFL